MTTNRRNFLRKSIASVAGMTAASMFPSDIFGKDLHSTMHPEEIILKPVPRSGPKDSIRFSVIGLNHDHIYGMVKALIDGGGTLVAVYSKEAELLPRFTRL